MVDTNRQYADRISSPENSSASGGSIYSEIVRQQQTEAQKSHTGTGNSQPTHHHWYDGILAAGKDIIDGAVNEVEHHPLDLLKDAAIGAAAGAAFMVLSPEITAAAGLAAAGAAGYKLIENVPTWIHDGNVVAHPDQYSQTEQAQAKAQLEGLGAGSTEFLAGFGGALVGGFAAGAGKSVFLSGKQFTPAQEVGQLDLAADQSFNSALDHVQVIANPRLLSQTVRNDAFDYAKKYLLADQ